MSDDARAVRLIQQVRALTAAPVPDDDAARAVRGGTLEAYAEMLADELARRLPAEAVLAALADPGHGR
jgi:hypothetical protein